MKLVTAPATLLSAANMASNITSSAVDVLQVDVLGIQITYSGASPAGTLTIQGSLDGVSYTDLYFTVADSAVSSLTIPTATSPILVDMNIGSLAHVRVAFTTTGGSVGTMNAVITKKRIGD
jgi:hypothetical protein